MKSNSSNGQVEARAATTRTASPSPLEKDEKDEKDERA